MAEKPTCSCGKSDCESGKKRIIFPCAGVANTGQITNLAAIELTKEGYGGAACIALLATGKDTIIKAANEADEVIILDGCPVRCASNITGKQNINPDQAIVVTELGIKKSESENYSDDDIEKVVSAVWEGKGKKKTGCQ